MHRRRNTNRLVWHDYSQPGEYFVTMCTKDREDSFGEIVGGEMRLNEVGEIAVKCWKEIPLYFPSIELNEFVVMPNHVHGIIAIVRMMGPASAMVPGGAIQESPRPEENDPLSRRRMILPKLIGRFKQNSAKQINILRGTSGMPVWQRGYHDHIIRNSASLARVRAYIITNPQHWQMDKQNRDRQPEDPTPCNASSSAQKEVA